MSVVESSVLLGGVCVETTSHRGWSTQELAQRAADKVVYVGDRSHPLVREQAIAFKESIRGVIEFYLSEAVRQDRLTVASRLRDAGYLDAAALLEK